MKNKNYKTTREPGQKRKTTPYNTFYGEGKPLELFVRITVNNFVRNSEEKTLDKNA